MDYDAEGKEVLKCGFKIGGGIDQNFKKSPQGYTDNVSLKPKIPNFKSTCQLGEINVSIEIYFTFQGIYVTDVHEGSPASRAGLRMHDKILQCNGYDFTMVTHKKAVSYIRKHPVLNLLVARKGVTST